MSSVDDRIVNMQFNNKQFQSAATESQKTLEGLERTIANTGSTKGLSLMGSAAEQVSSRFSAMQVAGVAAIATIASKAVTAGLDMAKSLTIDPISAGFQEYETNLKSVQTIMANTGESVKTVGVYLNDLNHYSDQTIYNFSQMADSIGKFTAAGVKLPQATDAIKGMANTAALSGANAMQLNSAMYQMSQALASGTIKLMDWNSLVNANMGGQNIQNALKATAQTAEKSAAAMAAAMEKHGGSFRDSLTEGWLTSDVFTKTMRVMAGQTIETAKDLKALGMTQEEFEKSGHAMGETMAFTVEQLKGMGYSEEAAKELNRLSQASIESATKIKTFTQMIDVVKESVGSGFAKVFEGFFGNLKQAGNLWTTVGNAITGSVGTIFDSINEVLAGWRKLGGYTALWAGFGNIFQTLGNLIHPFVVAFQTILPSTGKAGEGLADLSKGFESVTSWMEKMSRNADVITPVLVGIAKGVKAAFGALGKLVGIIKDAVGSLDDLAGALKNVSLSDFTLDNALDFGSEALKIGRNIIEGIVSGFGTSVGELSGAIGNIASGIIDTFKSILGIHSPATEMIPIGTNIILGVIEGIKTAMSFLFQAIGALAGGIASAFQQLFGGMDALDFSMLFNSILTGALILTANNFAKNAMPWATAIQSFLGQIGNSLEQFTSALGTQAKAELIKSYAIAIGVLAAALVVLSFLDPVALGKSLTAMAVMLGMLVYSLTALGKVESELNMAVLAASLLMISAAMINLAIAVRLLGSQDLTTLAKGLGAMAIGLGVLLAAMFAFSKIKGSIAGMAGSIMVLALAMNVLAAAVLAFGLMDIPTLAKGLGAMAIGLGLLVGAMLVMDKMKGSIEGLAASIFVMSAALVLMATAVGMLGNMDMGTLVKGITFMAIGLGIMVGALMLLSGNTAGVLAGAGAMLMMAAAMNMLVGVILILGTAPWETVAKGLGFVAAALAVFLLAGLGAMYVAPGLMALGVSLALIGAALFLAGAGMLAFGTGFALLAAAGVAGVAILVAAFEAFIALLPSIAMQMAASLVAFLEAIAKAAPRIRAAVGKIFSEMLGVIKDAIPEIVDVVITLMDNIFRAIKNYVKRIGEVISLIITTILNILRKAVPEIVAAAVEIALAIMRGIEKKIPDIAHTAADIILALLNAIAKESVRLADGAAKALVKFINGFSDAIDANAGAIRAAGWKLAGSILDAITGGLASKGAGALSGAINGLIDQIPGAGKLAGLLGRKMAEGFKESFIDQVTKAVEAAVALANAIIANGSEEVAALQQTASQRQGEAYGAQAAADIRRRDAAREDRRANKKDKAAEQAAREAEKKQKEAERNEAKAKKLRKENEAAARKLAELAKRQEKAADRLKEAAKEAAKAAKAQEKAADKAAKAADKAQKAADKAQAAADKAADKVRYQQEFEAADLMGKYDMKNQEAIDAAAKAQQLLAKANEEAAEGNRLLKDKDKKNDAEGRRLIEQSKKTAQAAAEWAAKAQQARLDANNYYAQAKQLEAQAVYDRIGELEKERQAEEDARKAQLEYEATENDPQARIDLLLKRASAAEARSKAAAAQAQSYMDWARAVAATDAAAAMELLDKAEKLAQEASAAADEAKQQKDQAKQIQEQMDDDSKKGGPGGSSFTPSRAILADAASAVDRYSASLAQAEAMAAATPSPIQFVQNNNSPVALTPTEVYRQTKNLLSGAEIKMGVTT